jgi:hypothetical protein
MLNTSEVSLPAEVKIASSPPGCSLKNLEFNLELA